MWKSWFRKRDRPEPAADAVSGVSIAFLQKRIERFTTEQLSLAMKRGWRRDHHPVTFFATNVGDDEGAIIKVNGMFITMQHFDHRLASSSFGSQELPAWATHSAHSSLTYRCPGGIPVGETRVRFYAFLGLLCAELLSENVPGLFFAEEQVFLRNHQLLVEELRSGKGLDPVRLAATHL